MTCFNILKIFFFLTEIFLNFNLSYYRKGVLNTKRISIAKNYIK